MHRLHNSHSPFAFGRKEAEGVSPGDRKKALGNLRAMDVLSHPWHCVYGDDTRSNILLPVNDIGRGTPGHEENNTHTIASLNAQ